MFGRKYNLDYRISLICGAAASLISILAASDRITRENECKVQYLGDSLTNYEIIGNTHNEAITRFSGKYLTKDGGSTTTRTATSNSAPIKENEIKLNLIHNITTEVNECLAHYKTGDIPSASTEELPMAVQLELISFTQKLTEQNDIESVNQVAKEFLVEDTDALNLLEQYVTHIGNLDNKEEIRTFTIQLNEQIDELSISSEKAEYLKTILSIAENSYSLWTVKE